MRNTAGDNRTSFSAFELVELNESHIGTAWAHDNVALLVGGAVEHRGQGAA